MVIYLPETTDGDPDLDQLTPRQIVAELDKYVVGQHAAKRAVASARVGGFSSDRTRIERPSRASSANQMLSASLTGTAAALQSTMT